MLLEFFPDPKKAVEHLMSMPGCEVLHGLLAHRRNPRAKRLHCALSTGEDFTLTRVEEVMATRPSHVVPVEDRSDSLLAWVSVQRGLFGF